MAQGDIITPEVEDIITKVWYENALNGWTAKEIQEEVANRVQVKWFGKYKEGWPGLRAIQARLVKIKGKYNSKEFWEFEQPWHMGALNDYPVPAEAIPYVLFIQKWVNNLKNLQQKQSSGQVIEGEYSGAWLQFNHFDISIRQARWIARLYALEDWDKAKKDKKSFDQALYWLWTWSKVYTIEGIISWLSGTNPDTSIIDKALLEGWTPGVMGYGYVLDPEDKNIPGISRTFAESYSVDDPLSDIVKKQRAVKNERTHRTTE